ncbi:MAG: DUF4230 domain-containing protein [Planctomycetia bacterium]|nr:DUF4230 domain-containing protein [Planctomycetia bacterium]
MHTVPDTPAPPTPAAAAGKPAIFGGWATLLFGAAIFGGLAILLRTQQGEVSATAAHAAAQIDEQGKLRPLATVLETTRALKLVTVTVDSTVKTKVRDERWRGTASASVQAPVRYVYGVDLSDLDPDSIRVGRILGLYEITIPRPVRIATEVDGSRPVEEVVEVSGTRLRSVAGEFYLGLARKEIYEQARKSTLPKDDMERVERMTREQVEDLVRRFVGPSADVRVRYQPGGNR